MYLLLGHGTSCIQYYVYGKRAVFSIMFILIPLSRWVLVLLSNTKEESSSFCCFLHLPNSNEWKQLLLVVEALDSLLYSVCFFSCWYFSISEDEILYFLYTITSCSLHFEVMSRTNSMKESWNVWKEITDNVTRSSDFGRRKCSRVTRGLHVRTWESHTAQTWESNVERVLYNTRRFLEESSYLSRPFG